ncbi:uncharacterized protein [Pyrus communis]|uniref:uncharacterized protein n=1 Tax=Pyrus communis TaxID=23211 RepID=UPI0035C040DB
MVFYEAIISALIKGSINGRFLKRRHEISNGSRQFDRCRVKVEERRLQARPNTTLHNWEFSIRCPPATSGARSGPRTPRARPGCGPRSKPRRVATPSWSRLWPATSTRRYSCTRRWSDRCRFTWETSSAPPPSSPRSSTTSSSTPSPQTPPYAPPPSPISAPPTNATPPASRFLTACSITKASWPVRRTEWRTSCGSRTAGRWRLRIADVFAVDIHPAARIGKGVLFDHATGVVVGETAVIGTNVSILHHVTLGGTGNAGGDRHPKIGDGVLIGASATILGNVKIGEGAKIGAGSVVLIYVPARTTAVGIPARLVGWKERRSKHEDVPGQSMEYTSFIGEWSDCCALADYLHQHTNSQLNSLKYKK